MNTTPTPTHSSDHGDDLHSTVVCAVEAIRAILRGIPATNPAMGAAMALQFIADGLSHAADKYERIELDAYKASKAGGSV